MMLNRLIFQMKRNNIRGLSPTPLQGRGTWFVIVSCIAIIFSSCGNSGSESNDSIASKDSTQSFIQKVISTVTPKKKSSNEHCEFNLKQQTDSFMKDRPQYVHYKWNNQTKEATVLLDGKDTLVIHRGGCHYFELSVNLKSNTIEYNIDDSTFWFQSALTYAKEFFENTDYELMKKDIETHEYELSKSEDVKLYTFAHDTYDEFYIRLSFENKAKEMEVGYSYSMVSE